MKIATVGEQQPKQRMSDHDAEAVATVRLVGAGADAGAEGAGERQAEQAPAQELPDHARRRRAELEAEPHRAEALLIADAIEHHQPIGGDDAVDRTAMGRRMAVRRVWSHEATLAGIDPSVAGGARA